ncbi:MAG: methylated-DNA--[protein]-cysteine S-methyltransferase [Longimicrobiales bacterium]
MSPRSSTTIPSPVGAIRLVATDETLVAVELPDSSKHETAGTRVDAGSGHPVLDHAARELEAYFAGELRTFSVPLAIDHTRAGSDPRGVGLHDPDLPGTDFQKEVWRGLLTIPYGESRSYAWLAEAVGRPGAYRAVGAANGRNPLAIVVPCHRVIGADGSLTGYGGGLEAKRWLLDHEAAQADLFA